MIGRIGHFEKAKRARARGEIEAIIQMAQLFCLETKEDYDVLSKSGKLLIVDFVTSWYQPGQKYTDLAIAGGGNVIVAKVDVFQNSTMAEQCNITRMPTTILFLNGNSRHF